VSASDFRNAEEARAFLKMLAEEDRSR